MFQSLYRNQVKELKDEMETKQAKLQDLYADMKALDQEKWVETLLGYILNKKYISSYFPSLNNWHTPSCGNNGHLHTVQGLTRRSFAVVTTLPH